MQPDILQLNQQLIEEVGKWNRQKQQQMRMNIAMLTTKGKGELLASLRAMRKVRGGEIEGTSFRFVRHGVFVQKGVGRGNRINDSGRKRKPKDWFNKEIENIEDLADMVAAYRADIAIKAFKIA